jgi:hypothetical protein
MLLGHRKQHTEAMVQCVKEFLPLLTNPFSNILKNIQKQVGSKRKMYVNYVVRLAILKLQHGKN